MVSLENFLKKRLRLQTNRATSKVARPWSRKFPGYSVPVHKQPTRKPLELGGPWSPPGNPNRSSCRGFGIVVSGMSWCIDFSEPSPSASLSRVLRCRSPMRPFAASPTGGIEERCDTGHATIQDAIDAAMDDDVVRVAGGTFASFALDRRLTIEGAGAGRNACRRHGSGGSVLRGDGALVELRTGSAGSRINGFVLDGGVFRGPAAGLPGADPPARLRAIGRRLRGNRPAATP